MTAPEFPLLPDSVARDGFQIAPAWSDARMRDTFDTLQLYQKW